jgi:capsular exopolysaccharide synthesis family protein
MGRVHEALTRSEKEQAQAAAAVTGLDRAGSLAEVRADQKQEFDFVSYSLNTPGSAELGRLERELAATAAARREMAQPGREVELDTSRVEPHLLMFDHCDARAADEYNRLASSLISAAGARGLKRLLITSAQHGEGRTSVALNLACALARAKKRALLIDADLKRPSVLRLLGVETGAGLAEVIAGKLPAGAAALSILPHQFVVLPAREPLGSPAQLLASPAFREMLDSLDPDYEFILLDSPPLLASSHSDLLLRLSHAALLVIRPGKTSSGQLGKAIAPLTEDKVFGVALNRA